MSPPPSSQDVDRVGLLADRIASAVAGCPGVAALATGPLATYLPGRTVAGVAIRDTDVQIAVIARYGPPLSEVAAQVRAAVAPLVPGLRLDVHIDDIQLDDDRLPGTAAGAASDAGGAGSDRVGADESNRRVL